MSIECWERPRREATSHFSDPESTREYIVTGADSEAEAIRAIANASPLTITLPDTTTGADITISRGKVKAREPFGGGLWEGTVQYVSSQDQFDMRFTVATQGVKQFFAREQIRTYDCIAGLTLVPGDDYTITNVPDFGKQIGVTDEGVEGIEVEFAKVDFTITKKFQHASLAATYLDTLISMTPSVNHSTFSITWRTQVFIFTRGCLKFNGANVSQNSDGAFEITYSFSYSKNQTVTSYTAWNSGTTYTINQNASVGSANYRSKTNGNLNNPPATSPTHWTLLDENLTVGNSPSIEKEGWHYSWPYTRPQVVANRRSQETVGLIINRVYEYKNFNDLNL